MRPGMTDSDVSGRIDRLTTCARSGRENVGRRRMTDQLGKPIRRKEDPALLSGRGRYADDLPVPAGTLHAHVIRSPHPHANIVSVDASEALAKDGVWAVITGEDVRKLSEPFLVALKTPVHQWSLAVGRVRYAGEPVALIVAEDRYLAEDAGEL